VREEVRRLVWTVLRGLKREGCVDLEALEFYIRERMHRCGAAILERLLTLEDGSALEKRCGCGGTFRRHRKRNKRVVTVLGEVRLERNIERCENCGQWRALEDVALDVENTAFSPGVRRMMARTGAEVPFEEARRLIWELAGVRITNKEVERKAEDIGEDIAYKEDQSVRAVFEDREEESGEAPETLYIAVDGTGVPVLKKETEGRIGKGEDGLSRTREVKLGALFTQTTVNSKGEPVRDPDSTTYTGRIETTDDFGPRLYAEAWRRGLPNAGTVVVLGDGARWIWNLAGDHFPSAIQIVDFYHAKEHLCQLAGILFPHDEDAKTKWRKELADDLWEGRIDTMLLKVRALNLKGEKKRETDRQLEYFEKNAPRMRYRDFRNMGLFIGSGVVEAGCKHVIAKRLKQSGMRWTVKGANSIIALRCCTTSRRFEDYWEQRRAA